jgi:hypothetical protein
MKMLVKNGVASLLLPNDYVAEFCPTTEQLIVRHPVTGEPELYGEFQLDDYNAEAWSIIPAGELPEDYRNKKFTFDGVEYEEIV